MLGKLFTDKGIDESLQHLIPVIPDSWYGENTFDEDGFLHSYDDVPIMMKKFNWSNSEATREYVEFHWYSHGELFRLNNLPPLITVTANEYLTWNEHGQLHSYNDMPSKIEMIDSIKEVYLSWHDRNLLSRDNLSPATVTYGLNGSLKNESFYMNGLPHRSNSLPSQISSRNKVWKVQGVLHNASGAAEHLDSVLEDATLIWSLYGLEVPETVFDSIRQLALENGIPLYAAFLVNMEIISLEHLGAFMDDTGVWKTDVPVTWVLRALNVTPEIFGEKVRKAKASYPMLNFGARMAPDEKEFKNFMKVIASEEADASDATSLRGVA